MKELEEYALKNLAGIKINYKTNNLVVILDPVKNLEYAERLKKLETIFDVSSIEKYNHEVKNKLGEEPYKIFKILESPSNLHDGKKLYHAILKNQIGNTYEVPLCVLTDYNPSSNNSSH